MTYFFVEIARPDTYSFKSEDIMLLIDDGHGGGSGKPTRKEMFNAMNWLLQGARPHDSLFFHCEFEHERRLLIYNVAIDSGHGGQTPDKTGREADGQDEGGYCEVYLTSLLPSFPPRSNFPRRFPQLQRHHR